MSEKIFRPDRNYEISLSFLRPDASTDEVDNLVGPDFTELYFLLWNRGADIAARRLDSGAMPLSQGSIARRLGWDETMVTKGLKALAAAGLIELLHLDLGEIP